MMRARGSCSQGPARLQRTRRAATDVVATNVTCVADTVAAAEMTELAAEMAAGNVSFKVNGSTLVLGTATTTTTTTTAAAAPPPPPTPVTTATATTATTTMVTTTTWPPRPTVAAAGKSDEAINTTVVAIGATLVIVCIASVAVACVVLRPRSDASRVRPVALQSASRHGARPLPFDKKHVRVQPVQL